MPYRSPLTTSQILKWVDVFKARRGRWPRRDDGEVQEGPGLTWCAVDQALIKGLRGLSKGSSLAKLLLVHRKRRHHSLVPDLTVPQILTWADAHHKQTGEWPHDFSGKITGAPGETWNAIHKALYNGRRGLPGSSSLAKLLETQRGVRNHLAVPRLTVRQILRWLDAHRARTGHWPIRTSGAVHGTVESWHAIDAALIAGTRGLPGGDSLAKLLARCRRVRNIHNLPPLTVEKIRAWAEDHRRRTGKHPVVLSGAVQCARGETWGAIDRALTVGNRGLPGGSSLFRVLQEVHA